MQQNPQPQQVGPPTAELRVIIALLGIITAIALGLLLHQTRAIVLPFALAVFISYILNPFIDFFEKRRIPAAIAILLALLLTFLLFGLLGILINESIQSFAKEFPKYETRFNLLWSQIIQHLDVPPEVFSQPLQDVRQLHLLAALDNLSIAGLITATLSSLTKFLSNTVLVLLFLLFILMGRNTLVNKLENAFSGETSRRIVGIYQAINLQVQKYIIAKTVISLITAGITTAVLLIFEVEFAMIWGILTFLLNFIPSIGSVIATILPLTITFIQFDSYVTIISVATLLILIQFIMGNFVDPRVVGRRLNLSPLVVIFSLLFLGWLWGIVGMFLAVPLSVVIKIIFENIRGLRFISTLMSAHS